MKKTISALLLFFVSLILFQCGISDPSTKGNGTQVGNAIAGKLVYEDGKPAAGAKIYLRPAGTLADTTGFGLAKVAAVDTFTTTTDDTGAYAIDTGVLDLGTYVIEGDDGEGNLVLIDSVVVEEDSTVEVPEDTLKAAGAIKGVIRLSEGGDPRKVFVLAFGIDRFARVEADGSFKFEDLAESQYDLRILSTIDDYGVLDTLGVAVVSADTTDLDTLELPFEGIPTVKNLKLDYDTLLQIVTLTWDQADSVLVKGYNVYRKDTIIDFVKINSALVMDTFYTDSSLAEDGAYEYKIAAVDPGDNEGDKSLGAMFDFKNRLRLATNAPAFGERRNHTSVTFNNKMWVIAGNAGNNARSNDVWSSTNGIDWVLEDSSANFPERSHHASVVHDGKIWIIGGYDYDGDLKGDVWYSDDGKSWTLATDSAGFDPRMDHSCTVYDGQIWIIGGSSASGRMNDVWSSQDGISWTLVTVSASFSKRNGHEAISFKDKLWVIGGEEDSGNKLNDVWSSTDGNSWEQTDVAGIFPGRNSFASTASTSPDSIIWIFGGFVGNSASVISNEVWYSEDGQNWGKLNPPSNFTGKLRNTSIEFDNKIWIIGPVGQSNQSEVWFLE